MADSEENASASTPAVFISYASQDAEAASRICQALREAGIEVWFDQSELRGGDAWDAAIRKQVKECSLFVPLISANTDARREGYFRREWNLAVHRMLDMAEDQPFLLPVVIDETPEAMARVPDRFRERQWLRFFASDTPAMLVARVRQLLHGTTAPLSPSDPRSGARLTGAPAVAGPTSRLTDANLGRFSKSPAAHKRVTGALAAAAAGALLVGGFAVYWNLHRASPKTHGTSSEPNAVQSASPLLSLAILPFTNATGDPKLGYIAEGLTASLSSTITNNLAPYQDAFVTPATVGSAYVGQADPVKRLGRDLGVHFVLQGNVQRAGSRIRLYTELVNAVNGTQVWSETYDGEQSDLLALQDKVRKNENFESQMHIAAARNSEARAGTPTAADYYVRGFALEFGNGSVDTKRQELALFRQMLALEPNSTKAMTCVASAMTDLASALYREELDQHETERYFEEGHDLAVKARVLGSKHPWVYEVLAVYARHHDDLSGWMENSKAWQQAGPDDLVPLVYVANASLYGGDLQSAVSLLRQALNMDQTPPEWGELDLLGKALFMLKDNAGAIEVLQRARTVNPSSGIIYAYLAMANSANGNGSAAQAAVGELRKQQPKFTFRTFAHLEKPMPTTSPIYKAWWETNLMPAWRNAGLPE
jgi:TolB-like protein